MDGILSRKTPHKTKFDSISHKFMSHVPHQKRSLKLASIVLHTFGVHFTPVDEGIKCCTLLGIKMKGTQKCTVVREGEEEPTVVCYPGSEGVLI